jgi:GlcNAc-PI de-N-acetylase
MSTALFLFPHQDDEAPVFHAIKCLVQDARPVKILYLTTGQASTEPSSSRNQDSLRVLLRLGVRADQIHFLNQTVGFPDGQLQKHLQSCFDQVLRLLADEPVSTIHMPAWEGGHQDHDAAHLLGLALAKRWGCTASSDQFPFYHGKGLPGILFRTLSPLPDNGPVISDAIPVKARWNYLRLLLEYRCQRTTWIGLGPFFILHYLLRGTQIRQPVSEHRVLQKPHEGLMLYERRHRSDFAHFQQDTRTFRDRWLT